MSIELKICGINSENIIKTIIQNGGCQYLGFVFYPPSPRNLTIQQSKKLTSIVPKYIKKVAVVVNPSNSFIDEVKDQFDYFQVYETSPARIKELKLISDKKIIKAIKVKKREDINLYKKYVGIADEFLFDSPGLEKSSNFNWNYLKNIEINGWFLAGGININNINQAKNIAQKIDISSSLEDNPGKKSTQKISDFLLKIKKL